MNPYKSTVLWPAIKAVLRSRGFLHGSPGDRWDQISAKAWEGFCLYTNGAKYSNPPAFIDQPKAVKDLIELAYDDEYKIQKQNGKIIDDEQPRKSCAYDLRNYRSISPAIPVPTIIFDKWENFTIDPDSLPASTPERYEDIGLSQSEVVTQSINSAIAISEKKRTGVKSPAKSTQPIDKKLLKTR